MSNTQTVTSVTVRMWEENTPGGEFDSRWDAQKMTVSVMTVQNVLDWFTEHGAFGNCDASGFVLEDIGGKDETVWELSYNNFGLFTFHNVLSLKRG